MMGNFPYQQFINSSDELSFFKEEKKRFFKHKY